MKSLASTRLTAPSSTLLKFLRSQADSLCFFTSCAPSNPCSAGHEVTYAPRHLSSYKPPSRSLTTTARRNATLEASLLNLDFLPQASNLRFLSLARSSRPNGAAVYYKSQDKQCQARWSSSDTEEAQWRRWFALRRWSKEKSPPLRPTGPLPFLSDTSGATLGRMKATNDMKLRCTEFDETGRVLVVDGEFRKQELIAKALPSHLLEQKQDLILSSSMGFSRATSGKSTPQCFRLSSFAPPSSSLTSSISSF